MKQRVELLQHAGLIDAPTAQALFHTLTLLRQDWACELTGNHAAQVITHLGRAIMRSKQGETITGLDPAIYRELRAQPGYPAVYQMNQRILALFDTPVPESEMGYLLANLHLLYQYSGKSDVS